MGVRPRVRFYHRRPERRLQERETSLSILIADPTPVAQHAAEAAHATTEAVTRVDLFLAILHHVPFVLLIGVCVWVVWSAVKSAKRKSRKDEKFRKSSLLSKIWAAQGDLWDANATSGQAFMLAFTHWGFYHIDLNFGYVTKLEAAVVLAISTVFATLLLAAADFDAKKEKWPLWILTFMASASFGALLASLFVDAQECAKQHECTTPSMLFNIVSMILIGIAYWKVGSMSRNARWHRFMAMNPPQSLVVFLTCIGSGYKLHIWTDKVVQSFLKLDFDAVIVGSNPNDKDTKPDGLNDLKEFLPESVREPLYEKAVAAVSGWIETIDTQSQHGYHPPEEHTAHLHAG